jgi:hypothetical protein
MRAHGVAVLLVVAASAAAASPALPHVLHDRVVNDVRELTIALERDGRCVPAQAIDVAAPFAGSAVTTCIATLVGPAIATPVASLEAVAIPLPPPPVASRPATKPGAGDGCELVPATAAIPVGRDVVAAWLFVTLEGKPTSDVELNVNADGARTRALRWLAPGIAAIEVEATAWQPTVDIVATPASGPAAHLQLPVDRGAPSNIDVEVEPAVAGRSFAVRPRVTTSDGVELPDDQLRVEVDGCTAEDERAFRCAVAGRHALAVALAGDTGWVPIDERSIDVAAPAIVAATTPLPRAPAPDLAWRAALLGGVTTNGAPRGGVAAAASLPIRGVVYGYAQLSWQAGDERFSGRAPVDDRLDVAEQQVTLDIGGRVSRAWHIPCDVHLAVGAAIVRQRATIDAAATSSLGVAPRATVGVGARVGRGRTAIVVDLDASAASYAVSPTWSLPLTELVLEVGVERR